MKINQDARALKQVYPKRRVEGEKVTVAFSCAGDFLIAAFEVYTRELTPDRAPNQTLWNGNVVELFLCISSQGPSVPGQSRWPYYEFEVSPYGQKCLVLVQGEGAERRDFTWDLKGFEHEAVLRPERPGWDAVMRIPLRTLGWNGDSLELIGNAFAILGPSEDARRFFGLNLPEQEVAHFHMPEHFVPLAIERA